MLMEFDEVLTHIGDIGYYQITLFLMLGAWEFMTADAIAMNFISGYMEHWCNVPALANFSHAQQKYIAIPQNADGDYEQCKRFDIPFEKMVEEDFYNWTRSNDTGEPVDCDEGWVFDQSEFTDTIRSDFTLVCNRSWLGEFSSTIYMFGILTGVFLGGILSDKFGRKVIFLGMHVVKTAGLIMATFAPNYPVFITGRFITAFGGMGAGVSVYVLIAEFTLSKWRAILGVMWFATFSVGYMVMPMVGYFVRGWVRLHAIYTAPMIIFFVYFITVDESPRWLISKGRTEEAMRIIHKVAICNGRQIPEDMQLHNPLEQGNKIDGKEEEEEGNRKGNLFDLFKTPNLRKKTLIIYFNWFTNNLIYYGLSLNSGALAGSIYINTLLLGAVEIPANILCFLLCNKIGRKWTVGFSLLLAALTSFIQVPLILQDDNDTYGDAITAMSIIGKAGVTCSFSGVYVITAEIFPTGIRNIGLGSASMCARISGLVAPYMGVPLMNVWGPLPSVIFGVCSAIAGGTMFLVPETLNKPIPETIEQAEAFGKKKKKGDVQGIDAPYIVHEKDIDIDSRPTKGDLAHTNGDITGTSHTVEHDDNATNMDDTHSTQL